MVKLKLIILTAFLLFCNACACDAYLTKLRGRRSIRFYKKYVKKKINPEDVGLKTNLIYEDLEIMYKEETGEVSLVTDPLSLSRRSYIRFFKTGTFYSYVMDKNEKLTKEALNPLRGNFAYVINKENRFMDYSPSDCGKFDKNEYRTKGDTLMISAGSNKGSRIWYYYIEKEVPKDWLDWQPDI